EKNFDEDDEKILTEDEELDDEEENLILKRFAILVFPMITLYGIYVILNGHLSPGGGFSGGAIIGAGLILFDTAFGQTAIHRFFNFKRFTCISVGCLLTYCACKSYSFFTGANHLINIIPKGIPGNILSGGLILPLNICVGLIVACTMYGFYALFTRGDI
ncbi:MAG: MnhB domain-containing protein, partial [Erysipelotrichaceae bacterium]|nr:MnhB domain-containing protein [Erysipelotrichaceae bacterium]